MDDELLDQHGQALGKHPFGRLGVLVFVVVQQFEDKRQPQERAFLGPPLLIRG